MGYNKKLNVWVILFTLSICHPALMAGDYKYKVVSRYSTTDQGKILKQEPFTGSVILYGTGRYHLSLHIEDSGVYKFVKKNASLAHDTIYFNSDKKFQFFAYPRENTLSIWLYKAQDGSNIWAFAQLIPEQPATPSNQATGSLITGSVFSAVTMYGSTSSPSYSRVDAITGDYLSDDTLGFVFRPNGTYALRLEFAGEVKRDSGRYTISGNIVRVGFSDGSFMDLTIVDGGKSLHWMSNGMLIGEYLLLKIIK